jgi:protein-disulfide isomerase
VAAEQQRKFWPFLLKLYSEYDSFSVDRLEEWAAAAGLDRAAFVKAMKDPATRKRLVLSKKEGLRNGVDATPTLFINGRRYYGDLDHDSLLDVLDEAADRAARRQFCDKGR